MRKRGVSLGYAKSCFRPPDFDLARLQHDRIGQRPQNIELELQDVERTLLQGAVVAEIVEREAQAVGHAAPRLGEAVAEVVQAVAFDPRVFVGPGVEALLVDVRGEQSVRLEATASCQGRWRAKFT